MITIRTSIWIKWVLFTACLAVIVFLTNQALRWRSSEGKFVIKNPTSDVMAPEITDAQKEGLKDVRPDRGPGPTYPTNAGKTYNQDLPDDRMNPLNQNLAYFLSNAPVSKVSLRKVEENHEIENYKAQDWQPSRDYLLKRGGVLGKQLYSADGKFLRCLPLSINVERGDNPDAEEHCADNIQWHWLDDRRLIGIQPIDLKDAPKPFGDRGSETEHTLPTPSSSRVYVLDVQNLNKIYEAGPLPELPPYYAIELMGVTKDGMIALQAVNHTDPNILKSEKTIKLGLFCIGKTAE